VPALTFEKKGVQQHDIGLSKTLLRTGWSLFVNAVMFAGVLICGVCALK